MLDLMVKMNARFTPQDRAACEPLVERIIELAELARRQGLLALEDVFQQEPDIFFKESGLAIVDGRDPELVRTLMSYMILSSDAVGADLLGKFVIAEGILGIQQGDNPRFIGTMLGAMLGGGYLARRRAADDEKERTRVPVIAQFYAMLNEHCAGQGDAEPDALETRICAMPVDELRGLMERADNAVCALAIKGCSPKTTLRIMSVLPESRQRIIIECWKLHGPVRLADVENAIDAIFGGG